MMEHGKHMMKGMPPKGMDPKMKAHMKAKALKAAIKKRRGA